MPRIFVPVAMRPLVEEREIVDVAGTTVREAIDDLERQFPGCKARLCDGESLRRGTAVSIGGSFSTLGLLQRVDADAEIHFLPAIGGG